MPNMEWVFRISPAELDMTGSLMIVRLLDRMQNIADEHADLLGVGRDAILAHNLVWVMARNAIAVERRITAGEQITLRTWTGESSRASLPRHFSFSDRQGIRIGGGTAICVLMDPTTRRIVSPQKAHLPQIEPTNDNCEMDVPQLQRVSRADWTQLRTPQYTELDVNGHLNNVHYAGWVLDGLPLELMRQNRVAAMQLNYHREIMPGDQCSLVYEMQGRDVLISGRSKVQDRMYFQAKLHFVPNE